jgi:hypothetical protein
MLVAIVLGACSGDTPQQIDANPLGPMCSKQTFDLCNEEHDCMSNNCQNFTTFQVCTVACTANDPCPKDKSGSPAECDTASGLCKPSAPNMCHL